MSKPFPLPLVLVLVLLLVLPAAVGCRGPRNLRPPTNVSTFSEADIGYVELAGRYNQTVRYFDQIWVRNKTSVDWNETLKNGDRRSRNQIGDGKFIFNPPRDSAMTVEHLGTVYLWGGSNDERYWLFDLTDSDNKAVYVGSFDALDRPGTGELPIPVRPDSVAYLLGLQPLPVIPDATEQPSVQLYEGQYFIEIQELNLRMLIDPQTFRPSRVYLTDRAGYAQVTSYLTGEMQVNVPRMAEGAQELTEKEQEPAKQVQPTICEQARIYVSGYQTRITITNEYATTDANRINDNVFNFDTLMRQHKPSVFINLDGAE